MNMRTKAFLLMSLLLLSLTCLSSCSNDDDDNNAGKSEIVGTWYLVGASDGWGGYKEYKEGEITITFTTNGEMLKEKTSNLSQQAHGNIISQT